MRFFFYFTILIIILPACYKRVEGCLDPLSSNFNPNTDDPCADCCKNPYMSLNLKHRLQDTFYKATDTVDNDLGQTYKLLDFSYYLSYFRLKSFSGKEWKGENQVVYYRQGQRVSDELNVILVRPNTFDYKVNESRDYGSFDSLIFFAGLPDEVRLADSFDVTDTHVLSDSLFLKNEFGEKLWASITIAKGIDFADTLTLEYTLADAGSGVRLSNQSSNLIGKDLNVKLSAEYARWFQNVDISAETIQVKKDVLKNLVLPFFVE